MKVDLAETEKTFQTDQDLAAKLSSSCSTQGSEWEERQKVRTEELVAIHETIKLLNDGNSLELFKETLAGTSLLQLQNNRKAIALVNGSPRGSSHLNLISMVLSGKIMDFTNVIAMIDEMVALFQEVQVDDDSKKIYCVDNVGKTEDEGELLADDIENHQRSLSDFNDQLSVTGECLEAETAGVEVEAVDFPEVDADRKDEATLRDAVAEEVLVPVVGAPQTGWRVDRFPQESGRMRLVSTPLWSLRPPTCEPELWLIIGKAAQRDEGEVASRGS